MAVTNICKFTLCRRLLVKLTLIENDSLKYSNRLLRDRGLRFFSQGSANGRAKRGNLSVLAIGLGAGALVGGGLSLYKSYELPKSNLIETTASAAHNVDTFPKVKISRKIVSQTDSSGLKLILFQYPTCPFCCKVRAFLDFNGLSYDVVEVDPVLRQQTSWSKYKKVPVLLAQVEDGYQQLNDSSLIISALQSYLYDQEANSLTNLTQFYPVITFHDDDGKLNSDIMNKYFLMFQGNLPKNRTSEIIVAERKWRKWADDVLVHVLSPNVYRSREEALQAFNWFSEVGEWDRLFPAWERFLIVNVGALAMWGIGKRLQKKYGLKPDVRQSLYDECNVWTRELKRKGTSYHGGASPDLADLAVYGVLSSIEGCTAFEDLIRNTTIGSWYNKMKEKVNQNKGSVQIVP